MAERPNLLFSEGEVLDLSIKAGIEANSSAIGLGYQSLRTSQIFTRLLNEELAAKEKRRSIFDSQRNSI